MAIPERDVIAFVKIFLPEEAHTGRIEAEFNNFNLRLKNEIADLVNSVTTLNDEISENLDLLQYTLVEECGKWNRLTTQERIDARHEVDVIWNSLHRDTKNMIAHVTDWFSVYLPGTLGFFNAALEKRLKSYRVYQVALVNQHRQQPPMAQAYGVKVRALFKKPDVDVARWQRFKAQVFPPNSVYSNDVRTGSLAGIPDPEALDRFRDPNRDDGFWQCKQIGKGGQGTAWAHEYCDINHNIIDRVVRKVSKWPDAHAFREPHLWHGGTTVSPEAGNCAPMEAHILGLMGDVPDSECENTVRLLAEPQVVFSHNTVRLYMEYACYGDVDKLVRLHYTHEEPVPAAFIWLVFRALLNNALIMEQGGIAAKRNPWSQIVYCDFKAENLFLGAPNENYYPHFPTPKLGDFGLAFPTNDQDEMNPDLWTCRGTRAHFAPEQFNYFDSIAEESMNTDKMLSPCNVYGIATIIYQLMERKRTGHMEQPTFIPEDNETMYTFTDLTVAVYEPVPSETGLCTLVRRCLNSNPNNRPKVDYLLYYANQILDNAENAMQRYTGQTYDGADTLLLPGVDVNLKWISRLVNGPGNVDADRVSLGRDMDEEMDEG